MPIRIASQRIGNIAEGINATPAQAQVSDVPYVGAALLRRDADGNFFVKETAKQSDGSYESGEERRITGNYYDPSFVVRGITTNRYNAEGDNITVDLPQFTFLPIRIFSGVERRYQVTRIYLNSIVDEMEIILCM